jgi:putative ABC transport system permease protein
MSIFSSRRNERDFAAEIESHIAIEADRLRQEGLSPAEAQRAARRRFGNILQTEERFYESRRVLWFEDLQKDLRYALRTVRQSPLFAATVILTLALGIGATAAIFAVTDAALIKPLPFPNPQRLVSLYERWQGDLDSLAPADYLDYRRQAKSFQDLAAYRQDPFNLGGQNRPERVVGAVVTPNFFVVLQIPAELGRTLDSAQDRPGSSRTVVLSYSLWKRRYAGSSDVIGRIISVDGEPRVIVGVMPPYFAFPGHAEMWAAARFQVPEHPLRPLIDPSAARGTHYFDIIGRLKPGVTMREAQAEAEVISRRLAQQYKDEERGDGPLLVSLRDDLVGDTRPAILILLGAVAVLFLIACANVANIVLARGATRQKEIAIRGSLGAGRLRLVKQLLVESFLLSLSGAALGLLSARYALRSLETLIPADVLPPGGLHIDLRLIAFAVAVSAVSTILFGLFPAIQAVKIDLNSTLKEAGRAFTGGAHANRSRKMLVVTQIALAAVLLTGAGLLIRSFDRLLSAPQGFIPDHVLSLQVSLPVTEYPAPADRNRFATNVLDRIRSIPGVRSAALTSRLPLNPGGSQRGIQIKGRPSVPGEEISPSYLVISPGYFRTLRIPILKGREFTDRDNANAPGVIVVSAAMARHFWPNEDPLGKYIKVGDQKDWSPVVGVVSDVAQQELDKASRPTIYVPYAQDPWPALAIVIRTAMDPENAASAATEAIHQVDKEEPVYNVRTMHEVIASSVRVRRFRTVLLALFACLALALAAIGIYGVMSYTVAQRAHEIGIRLALGAQPNRLRLFVVGEGLQLAAYGIVAGLVASLELTRFLSGVLYGVRSTDAPTFVATFFFLICTAFLASYIPARRAMNVDPANTLRAQ